MSDFIDGLERDLVDAVPRRFPGAVSGASSPARRSLRGMLVAVAALLAIAGTAAAATAVVLREAVIPAPSAIDAGPEQTPVPSTAQVSTVRAADPGGGPAWTVRVARGETGLVCSTVGQVVGGRFGLVGEDGRFRRLAPGVADACGVRQTGRASLIGARVLAARSAAGIRTIVNGVAGPQLRAVAMTVAGRPVSVPVGPGGTFVAAVRGYPEDVGITVDLRFANGRHERREYGNAPGLVRDPLSVAPAWTVDGIGFLAGHRQACVSFEPAREGTGVRARSPRACGLLPAITRAHPGVTGLFYALRRITGTARASYTGGDWSKKLPRTALWGVAGRDVRSVTILGAPDGPHSVPIAPARTLLAVLPASVAPGRLRVRVRFSDGTVHTYRGSVNLVPPPTP